MKTYSGDLTTEVLTHSKCYCIRRRDGTVFRWTDHDKDLVVSGHAVTVLNGTYSSSETGPNPAAIDISLDFGVDNSELAGTFTTLGVQSSEFLAGLFDHADVWVFSVDWTDDPVTNVVALRAGEIGESIKSDNQWTMEVRGLTQHFTARIVELHNESCLADFGDDRCKVKLDMATTWDTGLTITKRATRDATNETAANPAIVKPTTTNPSYWFVALNAGTTSGAEPSWPSSVGSTVTGADGIKWKAVRARAMIDLATTITSRSEFEVFGYTNAHPNAWWKFGWVLFTGASPGLNDGLMRPIRNVTTSGGNTKITVGVPFPYTIATLDTMIVYAGCAQTRKACMDESRDNILNFRGFPDVPMEDDFLKAKEIQREGDE